MITWGRVIAFCLRQPLLAERIGSALPAHTSLGRRRLLQGRRLGLPPSPQPRPTSVSSLRHRAQGNTRPASLPSTRRDSSSPRCFSPSSPVRPSPIGNFDTLKIEASDYDDGFAKIVHAVQPVSANLLDEEPDGIHVQKDMGIRLGWDDEQLLIWQNRQVLADPATPGRAHRRTAWASLPIASMCAQKGQADWGSLVQHPQRKALTLAGQSVSPGEDAPRNRRSGLSRQDQRRNRHGLLAAQLLHAMVWALPGAAGHAAPPNWMRSGALANPGSYHDANIPASPDQKGDLYEPLLPEDVELKYGKRIRVSRSPGRSFRRRPARDRRRAERRARHQLLHRLQALCRAEATEGRSPGPAARFQHHHLSMRATPFDVSRPRLGYPALLFTEMDTKRRLSEAARRQGLPAHRQDRQTRPSKNSAKSATSIPTSIASWSLSK